MVKKIALAFMLTMQSFLTPNTRSSQEIAIEEQEEPARQWDDFDRWLHHDDVSQQEIRDLFCDDPERIAQAQEQVFARQQEFLEFWNNTEERNKLMMKPITDAMGERRATPMDQRPGWEDDELPETFTARNFDTGELEQVPFDEKEGW